jgi:C4-dicarboxylate transporter, DcuC family
MLLFAGVVVLGLALVGISRRLDVRLVLFVAALVLAALANALPAILQTFLSTFSREQFVLPICSAMGFAYVLRQTGCDQHLVHLLAGPVRSLRLFLIPGTVLIGFLVNIPIISQAGTAVTIGPVLIPLLQAARLSPTTIGAALLLGSSLGGELFNPGAIEWQTLTEKLGANPVEGIRRVAPYLLLHLGVTTGLFWLLSVRAEWRRQREEPASLGPPANPVEEAPFRVNWLKAAVPLVPVVLLFLAGPPLRWLEVDRSWLIGPKEPLEMRTESRLIGAAMLLGSILAALVSPRRAAATTQAFFEGAGYAFTRIISVIVVANCFGKAMEAIGLPDVFGRLIKQVHVLLVPCALLLPLLFALLCGSGFASTQSLLGLLTAPAEELHVDPITIGALVSLGSAAGRTFSPVAAVVLVCSTLAGANPLSMVRRVAIPVLTGVLAVLMVYLLWAG